MVRFTTAINRNYSMALTRNYRGVRLIEFRNESDPPRNETATNATASG